MGYLDTMAEYSSPEVQYGRQRAHTWASTPAKCMLDDSAPAPSADQYAEALGRSGIWQVWEATRTGCKDGGVSPRTPVADKPACSPREAHRGEKKSDFGIVAVDTDDDFV